MLRPRLSRRRALSLAAILAAVGVGVWAAWPSAPWTSVAAESLPASLEPQRAALSQRADVAAAGSFLHTGHRAGAFQEYAIELAAERPRPRAPKPVVELMRRAYERLGLNAVEVDLHSSPFDERALVVVHNRVPDEPRARAYAEQNSLRGLLTAWRDEHAAAGRHLFLELKAPPGELDDEARATAARLAPALAEVLGPRHALRAQVHLISFSVPALTAARAGLGDDAGRHTFLQVITSNRYPAWVFALYGRLPPFDDAAVARLKTTPWLRGVFFDPRFVKGFGALFNGVNDAREAAGLAPLDLHISTYSHRWPELLARLDAEGLRLRHVKGLIHQVRSPAQ